MSSYRQALTRLSSSFLLLGIIFALGCRTYTISSDEPVHLIVEDAYVFWDADLGRTPYTSTEPSGGPSATIQVIDDDDNVYELHITNDDSDIANATFWLLYGGIAYPAANCLLGLLVPPFWPVMVVFGILVGGIQAGYGAFYANNFGPNEIHINLKELTAEVDDEELGTATLTPIDVDDKTMRRWKRLEKRRKRAKKKRNRDKRRRVRDDDDTSAQRHFKPPRVASSQRF